MKRELIALAVAGVSVLGCESSGLSPREVPGRSQPGLLYGMYENLSPADASAAPAKPLRLPVSVAVVQVGEVAPPQPMIDALRKDPSVFARVEALPYVDSGAAQHYAYGQHNAWEQGPPAPSAAAGTSAPRPSLAGIRRLAADTGMDYVLLVGGTVDHGSSGTPLSLLDITIVGGFIVPSRETRGTAVASAALIDVPTGRVIVNSSAEARRSSLVPAASVDGERLKLLQAIRDDVVKKLGTQVLADVRQRATVGPVAGAVPSPAPSPAALPQSSAPESRAPHAQSRDWQTVPAGAAYGTR